MKAIFAISFLFLSVFSYAEDHVGLVKKVIEDDEGVKIILEKQDDSAKSESVKTLYLSNTQVDFQKNKNAIMAAKDQNKLIMISKDLNKTISTKQVGQ